MKIITRFLLIVYFAYAALLFFTLMIPVFLFAVVASPAGAVRGGNLIYRACKVWADVWFPLVGIFHRNIYEEAPVKGAEYIYLSNHISWLDAALIPKVYRQPLRPLAKAETGKVPVFGFIYRKAVVSVDRSSTEHRARSVLRLKSVLRKGISVLVFPEGTFNETGMPLGAFYDGAFRIAIETGTSLKPVLFLDTYSRMPYYKAISLNPGRSRAVFLETIPVAGLTLADVTALKEKTYRIMEAKLRAYNAAWIGNTAAGVASRSDS